MMRQTNLGKILAITMIALLAMAAPLFATITSVSIEDGLTTKNVYKGDTFTVPVVVSYTDESIDPTITGSGSDISCSSGQVQAAGSGISTPFTGCTASATGSKVFTATCGSVTDTITYVVTEAPSWSVSITESSGTVTVKVTTTGTLSGVTTTLTGVSDSYKTSGPSITNLDLGDIDSSKSTSWTFSQGASGAGVTVTVTNPADTKVASVSGSTCGNGDLDAGEDCDGGLLNSKTCITQGYTGGTLTCSASCTFVTSACTSSGGDTGGDTGGSPGGSSGGAALPPVEDIEAPETDSTVDDTHIDTTDTTPSTDEPQDEMPTTPTGAVTATDTSSDGKSLLTKIVLVLFVITAIGAVLYMIGKKRNASASI